MDFYAEGDKVTKRQYTKLPFLCPHYLGRAYWGGGHIVFVVDSSEFGLFFLVCKVSNELGRMGPLLHGYNI